MLEMSYIETLRQYLDNKDKLKDELIDIAREIVKLSKQVIYNLIRDDREKASEIERRMIERKEKLDGLLSRSPEDLKSSVSFAYQEYVEARVFSWFLLRNGIPTHEDLGVEPEPYLMGLSDFCGELTRKATERMISGDLSLALIAKETIERVYYAMLELNPRNYELRKKVDYIANLINRLNDNILKFKLARAGIEEIAESGDEE